MPRRLYTVGLVLLTLAAIGAVVALVEGRPAALDVGLAELSSAPPVGKRVRVTCERLDLVWQEVQERSGKVVSGIAMCQLGDVFLPTTFEGGHVTGGNVVDGRLFEVSDGELWVRDGLRKARKLDMRTLDLFVAVESRQSRDQTLLTMLGILVATVICWGLWIRAFLAHRRDRRYVEPARVERPERVEPAPSQPSAPPELRGAIRYAATFAELTGAGIDARREDGTSSLVLWRDVVRVASRRLPFQLGGHPVVDVTSPAGVVRILPWTRVTGAAIPATDAVDRARAILRAIREHCPTSKIDSDTAGFAGGGLPAQLDSAEILDRYDAAIA